MPSWAPTARSLPAGEKSLLGRLSRLDRTTRNLLDNITAANRELVDRRLAELDEKRKHLEAELESLEHNALTEAEVAETVRQTARFAASLGSTLGKGRSPSARRPSEDASSGSLWMQMTAGCGSTSTSCRAAWMGRVQARLRRSRLPSRAAQKTGQSARQEW